jgi:hypothetical protein
VRRWLPTGSGDRRARRSKCRGAAPHATWEQTTNFFAALAKGDPDRDAVLKQLVRQLAL